MSMETIKLLAGLDIGNGYTKSSIIAPSGPVTVDIPSGCAYVSGNSDIKADTPERVAEVIGDIFNQMDVSFDSPVVKGTGRRWFGLRGVQSGFSMQEFDVFSHISKAEQDLSGILVLGCIAGACLQEYWKKHEKLPDDILDCHSRIALALPIQEYKKFRKEYGMRFTENTHIVTFHNFAMPVRVKLSFDDVQVLAEGASAQYALGSKGAAFLEEPLKECRKYIPLEGITASDVLTARTTVGVDIGEGTTNFPVFRNGIFDPDVSISMDKGYGSILTRALDRLKERGYAFGSRKALADYLQTPPSVIKKATYNNIAAIVEEEKAAFIGDVKAEFIKVMSRVGAYAEVVYVYGGGATPVEPALYPELLSVCESFSVEIPVLYLGSSHSRTLNRDGLIWITQNIAQMAMDGSAAGKKKK